MIFPRQALTERETLVDFQAPNHARPGGVTKAKEMLFDTETNFVAVLLPSARGEPDFSGTAARRTARIGQSDKGERMWVIVRDNNIDQVLRVLKKIMECEGIFRQ